MTSALDPWRRRLARLDSGRRSRSASRWIWAISLVATLGAGLVLTFLLAVATNNRLLYERYYTPLLWVNVVIAGLLMLVIAVAGVRLVALHEPKVQVVSGRQI